MFSIEALPAEYGDSLWIEYGPTTKPMRILIDCGTKEVFKNTLRARIKALSPTDRHFELFIVSHIDADHIGGAIDFIAESKELGVTFGDIWFNGYKQLLEASPMLGALQAEELTGMLEDKSLKLPWNKLFSGSPVMIKEEKKLPCVELAGGMTLTLLSPTAKQLVDLIPEWAKICADAGIVPGSGAKQVRSSRRKGPTMLGDPPVDLLADKRFTSDKAKPNGSSIAVMAEYKGKRMLLAADAHAPVLLASLDRMEEAEPMEVDVVKLAHHGSKNNTNIDLVKKIKSKNWIVSTNGKKFNHPDQEAIARVIKYGATGQTLLFNYRTEFNDMWDNTTLKRKHGYSTLYQDNGVKLEL